MADPIWFTTDELLEAARLFKGWLYRFQLKDRAGQPAPPQPTYPLPFLEKFGSMFGSLLPDYKDRAKSDTRTSNCVMFGEGLLLTAAALNGRGDGAWNGPRHVAAMQGKDKDGRCKGPRGVIEAYVEAGFAEKVIDGKEEFPSSWCIVQGDHHFWYVIDCDPGGDRKCLTLEANVFIAPLAGGEVGFVGHHWVNGARFEHPNGKAWGRPLDDDFLRTGTVEGWKSSGPKWEAFREGNKQLWFAKLWVREPTRVFSPMARSSRSSAVFPGYSNNERRDNGHGGYYVFGLHRNLHGGVHLFHSQPKGTCGPPTRVVAMAPGYVVAARFPGAGSTAGSEDVLNLLRNWPGFVLLRHELTLRPRDPKESAPEPQREAFYSLYMHLPAPACSATGPVVIPESDPYVACPPVPASSEVPTATAQSAKAGHSPPALEAHARNPVLPAQIPWFQRLYRARHGAWVRIRPWSQAEGGPSGDLGELYWSAEEVKPRSSPDSCIVYEGIGTRRLKVRDGSQPIFLHLPPHAKLADALADLRDGKVVTFDEPLFPVRAGEGVGYVTGLETMPPIRRRGRDLPDGFLHFQVFAPQGQDKAISTLVSATQKLVKDFHFKDVTCTDGNFLELPRFKSQVQGKFVDAADTAKLDAVLQHIQDKPDLHLVDPTLVFEMLDGSVSFAPRGFETQWELDGHCYPVRLDLEVPYLPDVAKHRKAAAVGGYLLEFQFLDVEGRVIERTRRGGQPSPKLVHLIDQGKLSSATAKDEQSPKQLSLVVQVPADTEYMRVKDGTGELDLVVGKEDPKSEELLFQETVAGRRWRDVKLTYANEWSLAEMDRAVDAIANSISKNGEYPVSREAAHALAWCDNAKEKTVARIYRADESTSSPQSLFAQALPPAKPWVCLHPMTAVWMLAMLGRHDPPKGVTERVQIEQTFDSTPFRKTPHPAFWGWIGEPFATSGIRAGDRVWLMLIDDDFTYDAQKRQVEVTFDCGGKQPKLLMDFERNAAGVAKVELIADFWGTCRLQQAGGGKPALIGGATDALTVEPEPTLALWTKEELEQGFGITRKRGKGFSFAIKFAARAPRVLNGYAWVQFRKLGEESWRDLPPSKGGPPPACYELCQVFSFADSLQQTQAARRQAKGKKPPEVQRDQFLPDTGPVLEAPRDPKKTSHVTPSATWRSYVDAYRDINLACSLAQSLQILVESLKPEGITIGIKPGSLSREGTSCTVVASRSNPPKRKAQDPPLPTAADVCVQKAGDAGLKASADKNAVTLTLDVPVATIDGCDKVLQEGLGLSADRKFIHRPARWEKRSPAVTASFDLPAFQRAFDKSLIRLHQNLAEGLELLRGEVGGLDLEYLSLDGRTCHLVVSPKAAARVEQAAMQYFLGVSLLSGERLLRLTAAPESESYGFVTVDGTQMLQEVEAEAPHDDKIEYRFCYLPMALFHQTNKERLISKPVLDRLCGETLTLAEPYRCPEVAGTFQRIGFPQSSKPEDCFVVQCGPNGCGLVLQIELHGDLEEWKHFQVVVTRNGKVDTRQLVVKSSLLAVDCGPLADMNVKLEAVLKPTSPKAADHPVPKPFTCSYTYKPGLSGEKVVKDGDDYLVTATGSSLASPIYAVAGEASSPRRTASAQEARAQAIRLEFSPNDAAVGSAKLDELVQYGCQSLRPKDKKAAWKNHGYCDARGHFEARLPVRFVDPASLPRVNLVAVPNQSKSKGLISGGTTLSLTLPPP